MHYPIRVRVGAKGRKISKPSELVRRYPTIVNPSLQRAILAQSPECLFANGQGVMIGHGQLWFAMQDGGMIKIIAITLDLPDTGN